MPFNLKRSIPVQLLTGLALLALPHVQQAQEATPSYTDPSLSRTGSNKLPPILKVVPRRPLNPRPPAAEIGEPAEQFFTKLTQNDIDFAYRDLMKTSPLGEQKAQIESFVNNTEAVVRLYGKAISFELVDHYNVGGRLKVLTYFTHHPTKPIRWRLIWYKPEERWILMDLRVDDVLEDYLE